MKDQSTPSRGPYAIYLLPRMPDGKLYPTVAGDGWKLTASELARGARMVKLPPELQHGDPATLLQLCYDGAFDLSGAVAVPVVVVRDEPESHCFPEDGLEGG